MKAVNFPKSVTIRLNEGQLDRLMMNANLAGQTESEYIRNLIDGSKTMVHHIDKEAVRQINKFGNLLNQIAARLNSGNILDSNALTKIEQIRTSVDILVNCILNKSNKSSTKISTNFMGCGVDDASQSHYIYGMQEKSVEKTITESVQEVASLAESLDKENPSDINSNVDTTDSAPYQNKDSIQITDT
jgi:hypothetical protein